MGFEANFYILAHLHTPRENTNNSQKKYFRENSTKFNNSTID